MRKILMQNVWLINFENLPPFSLWAESKLCWKPCHWYKPTKGLLSKNYVCGLIVFASEYLLLVAACIKMLGSASVPKILSAKLRKWNSRVSQQFTALDYLYLDPDAQPFEWMVGYQLDDEPNLQKWEMLGNHHFHPFKTGCLFLSSRYIEYSFSLSRPFPFFAHVWNI